MSRQDDEYIAGLMAMEASMGRDGWVMGSEYQVNEAAAFAAMQMDKENINMLSEQDFAPEQ